MASKYENLVNYLALFSLVLFALSFIPYAAGLISIVVVFVCGIPILLFAMWGTVILFSGELVPKDPADQRNPLYRRGQRIPRRPRLHHYPDTGRHGHYTIGSLDNRNIP